MEISIYKEDTNFSVKAITLYAVYYIEASVTMTNACIINAKFKPCLHVHFKPFPVAFTRKLWDVFRCEKTVCKAVLKGQVAVIEEH